MARTIKDKPYKARNRQFWPYGYYTRWNDCYKHGKLCSHCSHENKDKILSYRQFFCELFDPEDYLLDHEWMVWFVDEDTLYFEACEWEDYMYQCREMGCEFLYSRYSTRYRHSIYGATIGERLRHQYRNIPV